MEAEWWRSDVIAVFISLPQTISVYKGFETRTLLKIFRAIFHHKCWLNWFVLSRCCGVLYLYIFFLPMPYCVLLNWFALFLCLKSGESVREIFSFLKQELCWEYSGLDWIMFVCPVGSFFGIRFYGCLPWNVLRGVCSSCKPQSDQVCNLWNLGANILIFGTRTLLKTLTNSIRPGWFTHVNFFNGSFGLARQSIVRCIGNEAINSFIICKLPNYKISTWCWRFHQCRTSSTRWSMISFKRI